MQQAITDVTKKTRNAQNLQLLTVLRYRMPAFRGPIQLQTKTTLRIN